METQCVVRLRRNTLPPQVQVVEILSGELDLVKTGRLQQRWQVKGYT